MLKYTTILESKKFKLSKVKSTIHKKVWYSLIWKCGWDTPYSEITEKTKQFGKCKSLSNGVEWKFKNESTAYKCYNWALLRWA